MTAKFTAKTRRTFQSDGEPDWLFVKIPKTASETLPRMGRTGIDDTTIARLDWIHWIVTAKQAKTRDKRIFEVCDKLTSSQRRVCCFDPSGIYCKALKAPLEQVR